MGIRNTVTVKSVVYVMKHGGDLLSREVLTQLGVGQFSFAPLGKGRVDKVSVDGDEDKETEQVGLSRQGMFLEVPKTPTCCRT